MKIINKAINYFFTLFFVFAIGINAYCRNLNIDFQTSSSAQVKHEMGSSENINSLYVQQIIFLERLGQLHQSTIQNLHYVQPSNIIMPQYSQQSLVNKMDARYKNFHIFISAEPIFKIEQLAEHHFPTTFPK